MRKLPLPAGHADRQHEFATRDTRNHEPVLLPPLSPRTLQVLLLRPVAPFADISDMSRRSRVLTSDQDHSTSSFENCPFVQSKYVVLLTYRSTQDAAEFVDSN
jgi:hypothetical protein